MSLEDQAPAGATLKDGRLWHDVPWLERQKALWSDSYLQRQLPKSLRQSLADQLRWSRHARWDPTLDVVTKTG